MLAIALGIAAYLSPGLVEADVRLDEGNVYAINRGDELPSGVQQMVKVYVATKRVISVGDWTRELCGGTHAERTTQLGTVTLLGEASIGSGVRRVEALVGNDAHAFLAREHAIVGQLTEMVKARPEELPERISGLLARIRESEREIERLRGDALRAAAGSLTDSARDVGGVTFVGHHAAGATGDEARTMVLDTRAKLGNERPVVVAIAADAGGKPAIVVATNDAARARGLKAGALVRVGAQVLGGGGGGKDDIAQGGGQDASQTGAALTAVEAAVAAAAS